MLLCPLPKSHAQVTTAPVAVLVFLIVQSSEMQDTVKLAVGPPGEPAATTIAWARLVVLAPLLSVAVTVTL